MASPAVGRNTLAFLHALNAEAGPERPRIADTSERASAARRLAWLLFDNRVAILAALEAELRG